MFKVDLNFTAEMALGTLFHAAPTSYTYDEIEKFADFVKTHFPYHGTITTDITKDKVRTVVEQYPELFALAVDGDDVFTVYSAGPCPTLSHFHRGLPDFVSAAIMKRTYWFLGDLVNPEVSYG